ELLKLQEDDCGRGGPTRQCVDAHDERAGCPAAAFHSGTKRYLLTAGRPGFQREGRQRDKADGATPTGARAGAEVAARELEKLAEVVRALVDAEEVRRGVGFPARG